MTIPNVITFLRILLIPLFIYFLLIDPGMKIASIIFVVIVLGDALDGVLARFLKQTSDLGKFLDPLADKTLVLCALIGLVELKIVSSLPVMIIGARELLVMGLRVSQASKNLIIQASLLAKWKTVFQFLAVFMLMLKLPYATEVLWFAVVLTVLSGVEYFWLKK